MTKEEKKEAKRKNKGKWSEFVNEESLAKKLSETLEKEE